MLLNFLTLLWLVFLVCWGVTIIIPKTRRKFIYLWFLIGLLVTHVLMVVVGVCTN